MTGRSVLVVMISTVVAGLSGLIILAVTARSLGASDYATFGVFWSAMFFVVAVLFGAQQESTRSVAQRTQDGGRTSLSLFALILGLLAAVMVILASPAWQPSSIGWHRHLVLAVAFAALSYSMSGVLAGALAGAGRWNAYASMVIVEGIGRLLVLLLILAASGGVGLLAWGAVIGYPMALLAGVIGLRRAGLSLRVDDPMSRLARSTVKTMVSAASIAALVNGFPLLMSTFARGAAESSVGALTLAVMLTRAPLLIPLMAMQSPLITRFSAQGDHLSTAVLRLVAASVGVAGGLGVLASLIGPAVLGGFFGAEYELTGRTIGLLVLSSGFIGALSITSPALIASNRHGSNVLGWIGAVLVTVGVLAVAPGTLEVRAPVALLAGPTLGVLVHMLAVVRTERVAAAQR